jgi:hypothetical protein
MNNMRISILIVCFSILAIIGCDDRNAPTHSTSPATYEEYERQQKESARQLKSTGEFMDEYKKQLEHGQQNLERMDRVLDRWEKQAERYDRLLDRWEQEGRSPTTAPVR